MKKVVIITNIMAPYRVDLFNYLYKNSNYDTHVIYSAQSEGREWKIENINHKFSILKSKTIKINKKLDSKYIHIPKGIIKQLNKINPDVIIGSEYNPTVIASFIWCKLNNKKFISWSDGTLNSEKNINIVQRKLRNIICKNANAFIASSTKTKEAQIKYGAKAPIFTSYLTIDIDKYLIERKNCNSERNNILYVGSLIERKGLDLLFNALKHIDMDYTLNIVGSGELKNQLCNLSQRLSIGNKINFLGFKQRHELVELYKESDIFILPTREDCFGLVINEAMCAGLPVIASKYSDGAYDLIDEGKGGYIIDPYNELGLKNAIEKLLKDKELKIRMGLFNQDKIKEFSIENVSKEYINAINYVIN